jgi:serine/threonine protein kinase
MGGAASVADYPQITVNWRSLLDFNDARVKFIRDHTLTEDSSEEELELRVLLDDMIALKSMKEYASEVLMNGSDADKQHAVLFAMWEELNKFPAAAGIVGSHRETTTHNRSSFLTEFAVMFGEVLREVDPHTHKLLGEFVEKAHVSAGETLTMFQTLRRCCVVQIFSRIFLPYRETPDYDIMCDRIKSFYNCVTADDFTLTKKIAEGGFGIIFQCTKKSTGIDYAMKVQPKAQLLRHFKKDPAKVLLEMQAYARCVHPYLAGLEYAFHTPSLAVLVMPLASCGDLRQALSLCPGGVMPFDRVQFYIAEITDALCYLHYNGILYRDLKPTNILLNVDGHIRLADFGSVADMGGKLRDDKPGTAKSTPNAAVPTALDAKASNGEQDPNSSSVSLNRKSHVFGQNKPLDRGSNHPQITHKSGTTEDASEAHTVRMRTRTGSLVGTLEYMAPEIIIMFGRQRLHREGYTDAVDWWSLGITVYKLLVGVEPYRHMTYDKLIKTFPSLLKDAANYKEAFQSVFGEVNYNVSKLNEPSRLFIKGLLQFDASKRLGNMDGQQSYVTPSSYAQNVMTKYNSIREHIFFKDLDWGLLETKQLPPPYLPLVESVEVGEANKLSDFFAPGMTLNECLVASNKGDWISSELSDPRVFKEESQRLRAEANRVKYMVTDDMNQYFVEWNHCSLIAIEEEIKAQMSTNKAGDTRPSAPGGCCVPFIS